MKFDIWFDICLEYVTIVLFTGYVFLMLGYMSNVE